MKILVFVEVDVVIRHFIHSQAFKNLSLKHDVAYVFPPGYKRLGAVDLSSLDLGTARNLSLPADNTRLALWRRLFFVEQLRGSAGLKGSIARGYRKLFRTYNPPKAYIYYRFLGLPLIFFVFSSFTRLLLALYPNKPLHSLLHSEKPDLILHPCVLEGAYINDLVHTAGFYNIPTVIIMNSWDNPASKRSVVGTNYWLLVWGPQTRAHAEQIMRMPQQRIIEFGAAQFDVYKTPPLINRETLISAHGLTCSRPVLMYAGSSKSTDEFDHLQRLDVAITKGLLPALSIIYRPHPWGEGGKGGSRFLTHSFNHVVVDVSMRDYLHRVSHGDRSKSLPDYADTRDLLHAVDGIISPLSTLLIEAMMLGKPPLCFMPLEEHAADHFQLARHQIHFDELLSHPEVVVAWGLQSLIQGVSELLQRSKDPSYSERLRISSQYFVKSFSKPFSERIVELSETICAGTRQ